MPEHIVENIDGDIRLDRWFKRHYPALPHALLEKQLRKGVVRVDGKKAKSSDRVFANQIIICPELVILEHHPKPKLKAVRAFDPKKQERIRNMVIYEDARVFIINKPPGLAVQGGTGQSTSVDDLLDGLIGEDGQRPKLVHRLDMETSGVLVLARNSRVASQLGKIFAGSKVEKTYLALVNGSPLPMKGVVDFPLIKRVMGERSFEAVDIDEEEGKYAKTEYRVLESMARKFALMELRPVTGRTHQLRVHMAAIECPIVGDHKYGLPTPERSRSGFAQAGGGKALKSIGIEDKLHLHARQIKLPPFGGGGSINIKAPLPAHMKKSFDVLGLTLPK